MTYGNIVKTSPDIVITMIPMIFRNNVSRMFLLHFCNDFAKHSKYDTGKRRKIVIWQRYRNVAVKIR
jgi:hypothetical protein